MISYRLLRTDASIIITVNYIQHWTADIKQEDAEAVAIPYQGGVLLVNKPSDRDHFMPENVLVHREDKGE